jgi:uncharacterized membrane protein
MPHNHDMTVTADTRPGIPTRWHGAVPVGIGLVVAELLLAVLWYPWVVEHLVLRSGLPFEVLRLLIVAPEYLLLALAVHVVGLNRGRRVVAVCFALLAGLVSWGTTVLISHLAPTPLDFRQHRDLFTFIVRATLILVPTFGALAWGAARRLGRLWLLAVPIAPVLHYWIQTSDWPFRLESRLSFRESEAVGMSLVIVPVLLAILCCWALEQVEHSRSTPHDTP